MESWWHFDSKEVSFFFVCVFICHFKIFFWEQFGCSFIELFALLVFIFLSFKNIFYILIC